MNWYSVFKNKYTYKGIFYLAKVCLALTIVFYPFIVGFVNKFTTKCSSSHKFFMLWTSLLIGFDLSVSDLEASACCRKCSKAFTDGPNAQKKPFLFSTENNDPDNFPTLSHYKRRNRDKMEIESVAFVISSFQKVFWL